MNYILVSSINVRRTVTLAQTPRVWANWTIAIDASGNAQWAFGRAGENRHPVRRRAFREHTQSQFNLFPVEVLEGINDPRPGASRPPRSVASALREQIRKRIWNENRRSAQRAEQASNEATLFA